MIYREDVIELDYAGLGLETPKQPAFLTSYILDRTSQYYINDKRPAVIFCPGGGYEMVCPAEGEPVTMCFAGAGCHTFVLHYSTSPVRFPGALLELSKAVAWVRAHAEEYRIDPDRIFVGGFSAGGHLAGSLGVYWHESFIQEKLGFTNNENKPNGLILCYPVISGKKGVTHVGSICSLCGSDSDEDAIHTFSLEEHISEFTPPTFLWHTADDDCVPVANSLLFAQGLREKNIPFELHIFPHGPHGLSIANEVIASWDGHLNPTAAQWVDLAIRFVQNN